MAVNAINGKAGKRGEEKRPRAAFRTEIMTPLRDAVRFIHAAIPDSSAPDDQKLSQHQAFRRNMQRTNLSVRHPPSPQAAARGFEWSSNRPPPPRSPVAYDRLWSFIQRIAGRNDDGQSSEATTRDFDSTEICRPPVGMTTNGRDRRARYQ